MARIYTMGEILVEIMREERDVPLGEPGRFLGPYPSGAPAIFISTAAQLGHDAKIWGGVGSDAFGKLLLERLTRDGVDCTDIRIVPGGSSGVAFVAYDSGGDREFIFHLDGTPAADIRFQPDRTPPPDYFHVMGCSLMISEQVRRTIQSAVDWAASAGARISFDPNIRPELLQSRSLDALAGAVMAKTSVFLPGVEELALFAGREDRAEGIRTLFADYPALEIIHLKKGKEGSEIHTREGCLPIPPYPIERVMPILDPTGAGDSFDAAFLCGLAEGMPLAEAGGYAAKAGAINATRFGPMGGDQRQIKKDFLQEEKDE